MRVIKANSRFNNKFCFNINFEDIIERLSITCSVKKTMTFNSRCVTYIHTYINSNFRVAKHANIFELTQNKNYIENIYIYTLNARKEKYHLQFTILSLSMSGKKNLHEGNILYFSLKVCKKTGTKKVRQCIPLFS